MNSSGEGSCGLPFVSSPSVLLGHGGGGRLTQQLIQEVFRKQFTSTFLKNEHDSAVVPVEKGLIAFTTDTYVVRPIFFPGGDIGKLAIYGTVNDLAMAGARPHYISLGMILEEGFSLEFLQKITQSIQLAALKCEVEIVTGDTKVVERGKGDGIFINTSGLGSISHHLDIQPSRLQKGDAILVSGDLGRHGIAIMAAREGLEFETALESDCAPLSFMVMDLIESGIELHCLRDLTRGGLASALNEIASTAHCEIEVVEEQIPVHILVQGACEILGLDPLYVANEGRMVAFVPEIQALEALERMKRHAVGSGARLIGRVTSDPIHPGRVLIRSRIGILRVLDLLNGEQLPRIC